MEISKILEFIKIGLIAILIMIILIIYAKNNVLTIERDRAITDANNLRNTVDIQNQAIIDWQDASKVQAKRIEDSKVQAVLQIKSSQEQAKKIMESNVPQDCDSAIIWAISQAESLKDTK